jgi:hypothetical protein
MVFGSSSRRLCSDELADHNREIVRELARRGGKGNLSAKGKNVSHLFPSQLHWGVLNGIFAAVMYSKPLISYDAGRLVPAGFACVSACTSRTD